MYKKKLRMNIKQDLPKKNIEFFAKVNFFIDHLVSFD